MALFVPDTTRKSSFLGKATGWRRSDRLTAQTESLQALRYLCLGDGFASGWGFVLATPSIVFHAGRRATATAKLANQIVMIW